MVLDAQEHQARRLHALILYLYGKILHRLCSCADTSIAVLCGAGFPHPAPCHCGADCRLSAGRHLTWPRVVFYEVCKAVGRALEETSANFMRLILEGRQFAGLVSGRPILLLEARFPLPR